MIVISQNLTTNFVLMQDLQPDLSGALFFCTGKSPGKKKRERKAEIAAQITKII